MHAHTLQVLELSCNPLGAALPPLLGALGRLRELRVASTGIMVLPPLISSLRHLKLLDASSNKLQVC